jgi:4-amino-4-deoxy-L-arabinose transferase-like glycosyltransferase
VNRSLRSYLVAAAIAVAAAALYFPGLADAPISVTVDETTIARQGHSVATTGRDLSGRILPLYFETGTTWYPSILIYGIAAAVRLFGFSEGVIRSPMALAGVIDIVLVYFIGRQVFGREAFAVVAALLLATTPAHFIHSRFAMDYLMVVPFLLAWLLCLVTYLRSGNPRLLIAGGLSLGVGLYSYIAALAAMPVYVVVTGVILYRRRDPWTSYVRVAAGFLLPASLLIGWLVLHPKMIANVALKYRLDDSARTAVEMFSVFHPIQFGRQMISVYTGLLDPEFLFARGTWNLLYTTGRSGVFFVPVFGMLLLGLWRILRDRLDPRGLTLGLGFLAAPLAATLINDRNAIFRATELLPFGVLLATAGLEYAERSSRASARTGGAFLVLWAAIIWMYVAHRDTIPMSQAFLRASTVPMVLAGLAVLFQRAPRGSAQIRQALVATLIVVGVVNVSYVFTRGSVVLTPLSTWLVALIALAAWLDEGWVNDRTGPRFVGFLVGLVAAQFVCFYLPDPPLQRIPHVPLTLLVIAVRCFLGATVAVAALVGGAAATAHTYRLAWRPTRTTVILSSIALAAIQGAYFSIDRPPAYAMRYGLAAAVIVVLTVLAMLLARARVDRPTFTKVLAVAPVAVTLLHFGFFYADYFGNYRIRSSRAFGGNTQGAMELVISRTNTRNIPVIYIDQLGSYDYAPDYWRFYLTKHNRLDLQQRTDWGPIDPSRIRALPVGAVIITNAGDGGIDMAIARMIEDGLITSKELIRLPDGSPFAWILERGGG